MKCCVFQVKDLAGRGAGSNGTRLKRMLTNVSGRATKRMLVQARQIKYVGKERGKAWAPQEKKKEKSGKWNRSYKGPTEFVWDSNAVSDLTECFVPVQKPRAKRKLERVRDSTSVHECIRMSDSEKTREMDKAFGVPGLQQKRMMRRTGEMEQISKRRHVFIHHFISFSFANPCLNINAHIVIKVNENFA